MEAQSNKQKFCAFMDRFGGDPFIIVITQDEVKLLPVDLRNQEGEDGDYFAQKAFDSLRSWLGDGPFKVSWIGQWPCGRFMLYLNGAKDGGEPGVPASDFM